MGEFLTSKVVSILSTLGLAAFDPLLATGPA